MKAVVGVIEIPLIRSLTVEEYVVVAVELILISSIINFNRIFHQIVVAESEAALAANDLLDGLYAGIITPV